MLLETVESEFCLVIDEDLQRLKREEHEHGQ